MKTVYMIDTEYGTIVVSKKEYLYTKERIEAECHNDEIREDGYLKQYSYWYEQKDVNEHAQEITIVGYKRIVKSGTTNKPFIPSKFEKDLIECKNNYKAVLQLVDQFLKSH